MSLLTHDNAYCLHCVHATKIAGTVDCICEKKGVVSEAYSCKKFELDPFKLEPKKPKAPAFSPEDFSL